MAWRTRMGGVRGHSPGGSARGCTQAGRIEFALRGANGTGGRINTDFIDNSAGVDCSDNEVNIKIALAGAKRAGRLTEPRMAFVPRVIIGEGALFPELARFYHDHVIAHGLGLVERIIAHGVTRGEFACEDLPQASRSVIGGVLIAAIWKTTFEPVGAEPLDPAAMAQAHADTLLNGLLVRKDGA